MAGVFPGASVILIFERMSLAVVLFQAWHPGDIIPGS